MTTTTTTTPATNAAAPARTSYALLLAVLCSLNAGGLFASDINLPGVPSTAHALDVPVSSVQWTFSAFMIGIAISQAVYGPLSDAYGRKRVIVSGLGVFVVASVLCAVAPTVEFFGAGRLLQALGAGSGMVIGRAVISDLYEEKDAARMFATVMPIVGVSPSVAPLVGGYLTTYVSWRAPFVVTALIGLLTLIAMVAWVPESLPPERRSRHLGATLRGYPRLLAHPLFWAYTLNLVVAYGGYFGYLAASPLIFQKLGLATVTTSYCYITVSVAYVAGNLTSRSLVRNHPVNRLLWWGHAVFFTGALLMLGLGLSDVGGRWGLLVLAFMPVMTFGNGFLLPLSMSAGVTTFRSTAGSASGLMGALQLLGASLGIFCVSRLPSGDLFSLGWFVLGAALLGVMAFRLFLTLAARRDGDTGQAARATQRNV
ncbi:MFS transporter, DHA1 family, bicyclomycin/chloramphenicol resistance protein [Streptomyces sp. yr375]|uniref:multidrug effflux MFS transporter n=1 Tax=Streptomyces sp. yr375 TaxID=1761906 RepID=UPI0008D2B5F6|nr:multidrug effflux MFS transporter [Streptomyces sp. yr375]SER84477.1 MFS transporter, DHA1 family, bicyclomycin/chloramphenicol resistance protein [Streptomyces sp. yr375]